MKLSKNFTYEELCHSGVAERKGLKNRPKTKEEERVVIENLKALCMEVLQPLRDYLGKPVVISSGYRSEEVDRMVGGVKGSQHLKGAAPPPRLLLAHSHRLSGIRSKSPPVFQDSPSVAAVLPCTAPSDSRSPSSPPP